MLYNETMLSMFSDLMSTLWFKTSHGCCSRTQDSKEEILRHLEPTQSSRVTLTRWEDILDGTVVPEHRERCEVELPARHPSSCWSSELGQLGAL